MSDVVRSYMHHVKTWEVYPRVYYFRGRFIDFYKRFGNVIGKLPDDVKDYNLLADVKCLYDFLDKNEISILVFGNYDLTSEVLFISTQSIKEETAKTTSSLPSIVVCHSTFKTLGDGYLKEIEQSLTRFRSSSFYDTFPTDSLVIACKIQTSISDEEIAKCQSEIQLKVNKLLGFQIENANIIISSEELNIKERISCIYEKRIIDVFVRIRIFFGHFIKKNGPIRSDLMNATSFGLLWNTLAGILHNPFYLFEHPSGQHPNTHFLRLFIDRLAIVIRFNLINSWASKHSLPAWLCTTMCNFSEFEKELRGLLSNKSRYMLCTLERVFIRTLTNDRPFEYLRKTLDSSKRFAFIMTLLKKDLETLLQKDFESQTPLLTYLEKTISDMRRISRVMGRMEFEIDGYLKQTIVEHFDFSKKHVSLRLPDSLRQSVLRIDGVYGIGIIYDMIEVHLQDKIEDTEKVNHVLRLLMKEYHLQNSYRVKQIKSEADKTSNKISIAVLKQIMRV